MDYRKDRIINLYFTFLGKQIWVHAVWTKRIHAGPILYHGT